MATDAVSMSPSSRDSSRLDQLTGRSRQSRFIWLRQLLRNPAAVVSLGCILVIVVLAIAAPLVTDHKPTFLDPMSRMQEPSDEHWMGTDDVGRDVFSRLIYGARISLIVGITATLLSVSAGAILGLISGYYDRLDTIIMRLTDGLMAFPSILLAIAIMASLGRSTENVVIALAVVYAPSVARLVRGVTLSTKQQPYVESARAVGQHDSIILRRYILANALSPLIVQCTFVFASAIISEASLSFLGAGVPPETPTWGSMLQDGQRVLQSAWWLTVFPGGVLLLLVLSFNLLGDGLRDVLDPRMRRR